MLGVPSNLISTMHCLNYTSAWQNVLQQCSFLRVIAFFCTAHRKIRRPGGGLCHCKISILIFALLRICEIAVQFLHWNCNFYTAWKTEFLQCKNCNALSMCDCILEQCIFYTGIVKRSSAKQNGCSGMVGIVREVSRCHVRRQPRARRDPGRSRPRSAAMYSTRPMSMTLPAVVRWSCDRA